MSDLPVQPLQGQFRIADPETGLPTQEFLQWAKAVTDLLPTQEEALAAIEGAGLTALSERIALGDNTRFGDEIEIDADTQAILDVISNVRGSILYRGASAWVSLAPGTAGHFLRTAGAGADPAWAATGGGGGWSLVADHDFSASPQPSVEVDVTGLETVWLTGLGISHTSSIYRVIQVSVDGGSSWLTQGGDYQSIATTGAVAQNRSSIVLHGSSTSAARSVQGQIFGLNIGYARAVQTTIREDTRIPAAEGSVVNRIRFIGATDTTPNDPQSANNFTGGILKVLGQ